jgi:hypothetical protein
MATAGSSYAAFDADVATAGDSNHVAYLTAIADGADDAVKKIKAQIKGLEQTLAEKQAEAKAARSAIRNPSEG